MMKNYDEAIRILQLKENAITWDAIKRSYKKRALETHPDKQPEKDDTQFKEVAEAFEFFKRIFVPEELNTLENQNLKTLQKLLVTHQEQYVIFYSLKYLR